MTTETLESHADAAGDRQRSDRHVILYLAFLSALMAVSIDTALPAFDEIRDHFGLTSADNRVSLIITSFFIGAALGHLAYGPFSDRFGRGPVLRAGMLVYVLGAAGATLAPSMTALLAFRFVWGLGAAGSGVLRVAIARDLYAGNRMARVMSVVMAVFLIAPVIAPTIGEGLVRLGGWRLTMAGPGLMAVGAIVWSYRFGETLPVDRRRPLAFRPTLVAFRAVCSSPMTLGNTLALCFTFGAFYSFLGSSQPILDEIYGRGDQFAAFFAVAATAMGLVLFTGSRMMDRVGRLTGRRRFARRHGGAVARATRGVSRHRRTSECLGVVRVHRGDDLQHVARRTDAHVAGDGADGPHGRHRIGGRGDDVDGSRRRAVGPHRLADRFDRHADGGRLRRVLLDRPRVRAVGAQHRTR